MSRSTALVAGVLVTGCVVLVVAAITGSGGSASSDAATTYSRPTTSETPDATTTVASNAPTATPPDSVVVPPSEPTTTSAHAGASSPTTHNSPLATTAALGPGEGSDGPPPQVTIAEPHRAEVVEATDELLVELLPIVAEVDPDEPTDVSTRLGTIASEAILSELEAERLEFDTEDWSRTGSYRVDAIEVLEYSESGETASATVRACLDASEIVVRRADGSVVEPGHGSQRAWNIYTLERAEDAWRLVDRTFEDDPAC